ncbi:hypothetical protein MRX96_021245 [Rhipicephalus microplus]
MSVYRRGYYAGINYHENGLKNSRSPRDGSSTEDSKKFELVKKKFDEYFIKETNESTCFHKRHQMPGEFIDQFMTALHILA